jgi:hypothetical protein
MKEVAVVPYAVRADKNSPVIAIGDWIVNPNGSPHPTQVTEMVVNENNQLLLKTKAYKNYGISIEKVKKVDAPVKKKPVDSKKQEPVAKVGEYVIANERWYVPDEACKVTAVVGKSYKYIYRDGTKNGCDISMCRKATQEEIDRDWPQKEEKLIPVMLTQADYNDLKDMIERYKQ